MGASVTLITQIGREAEHRSVVEGLEQEYGIAVRPRWRDPERTIIKDWCYDADYASVHIEKLLWRADHPSKSVGSPEMIRKLGFAVRNARSAGCILLADFGHGTLSDELRMLTFRTARQGGVPVAVSHNLKADIYREQPIDVICCTLSVALDAVSLSDQDLFHISPSAASSLDWFVQRLMEAFPTTRSFLINDPLGGLLAATREAGTRGRYKFDVSAGLNVTRPSYVGSTSAVAASAALLIGARKLAPDVFFEGAHAAKIASSYLTSLAPHELPKDRCHKWRVDEYGPVPAAPRGAGEGKLLLEARVDDALEFVEERGGVIDLSEAKTCLPGYQVIHEGFKGAIDDIRKTLIEWMDERRPSNFWVFGPSGCGKTALALGLAAELSRRLPGGPLVPDTLQPKEIWDTFKEGSTSALYKKYLSERKILIVDDVDHGGPIAIDVQKALKDIWDPLSHEEWAKGQLFPATTSLDIMERGTEFEGRFAVDLISRTLDNKHYPVPRIRVPGLQERWTDLPYLLAGALEREGGREKIKPPQRVTKPALELLLRVEGMYHMRQVEHIAINLVKALAESGEDIIRSDHMQEAIKPPLECPTRTFHYLDDTKAFRIVYEDGGASRKRGV